MKNKTIIKRFLKLSCVMVILCISSCKTLESHFQLISDEDIEMTKSNCRNLILPASFVNKVRESEVVKSGLAYYETQYISRSINPETVDKHFYNQLVPQGWKYTRRKEGGDTFLYFDKGKFSIAIQYRVIGFSSDRLYSVGCRWGPSRKGLFGELFGE